ncbi:hypothetical protein [Streptomyces griseorubiginosus]|uniref:hypothetical protein n=1 Tax=Streptomyces griseorubiginosus TaxID=67304 RepID=UPI000AD16771|nr:hypothetical protein [Streptomyces griseorubiginosus]
MGWGNKRLNEAAAVCAAQFPAIGLGWWIKGQLGDDYAYGGAYGAFAVFALACLLAVAPLVLPVLGLAHALVQVLPAEALAHRVAGRLRGQVWAWHLLLASLLGVIWAVIALLLWDWPFTITAPLFAVLGVFPVLGLGWLRRRTRGFWGIWLPALFASVGLFLLVFVGGVLATVTGILEEYEPPKLSAAQLAGEWHGSDGAVLRLRPGGEAELTALPAETEPADSETDPPFAVCDGTATWQPDAKGGNDPYTDCPEGRPGVVVRPTAGCGRQTYWRIGGTAAAPELFVPFGDPDAPDVRILKRVR